MEKKPSFFSRPVRPDSGYSWLILVAACVIHFISIGLHYSFGLFFPRLLDEFGAGEGNTAWIGSISSGFLFLFSLLAVKIMNLTSVFVTCFFGGACAGIGLLLNSFVYKFELLYVTHSLLFGFGTCLLYTPSLVVIARVFTQQREFATGIVVASGSLGQLVLSVPLEKALEGIGVRATYRFIGLAFIIVSCISSVAFLPLMSQKASNIDVSHRNKPKAVSCGLLTNKAYLGWIAVMLLTNFSYYIPIVYLVNFSEHLGATEEQASYLQISLGLSSLIGRILFGKIANSFSSKTTYIYQLAMFATGVCSLAAWLSSSYWHIVLYTIVYGLLDGSFMGLMSIVTLRISGLEYFAEAWGIMLCAIGIPLAVGPATVGWMNDAEITTHHSIFYFSGIPVITASMLMFYVQRKLTLQPFEPPSGWVPLIQYEELPEAKCLTQRISVV